MRMQELEQAQRRLSDYVESFVGSLGRSERRHWCKLYLAGLMMDGERKSISPICERLHGGNVQAVRQFVNQSPWDHRDLMAELRRFVLKRLPLGNGVLILDDVSLPKKGKHSVGVAHQYCGALGKLANCQSIVSWQLAARVFHIPVTARLYLPESWTTDSARLDEALVPVEDRPFREKWKIALKLLDEIRGGLTFRAVTFDADYGHNRDYLHELDSRSIPFVGQTSCDMTFWDGEIEHEAPQARRRRGGQRKHRHVADRRRRPKSAAQWARELFDDLSNVRHALLPLKNGGRASYVAKRVYETKRPGKFTVGPERWLIIERLNDGTHKYYVSSFGERVSPRTVLLIGRERWKVEQGYQQLKEELGLDHFEGRSWRGLHHHVALTFMAYDFLQLLRRDFKKNGRKDHSARCSLVA